MSRFYSNHIIINRLGDFTKSKPRKLQKDRDLRGCELVQIQQEPHKEFRIIKCPSCKKVMGYYTDGKRKDHWCSNCKGLMAF